MLFKELDYISRKKPSTFRQNDRINWQYPVREKINILSNLINWNLSNILALMCIIIIIKFFISSHVGLKKKSKKKIQYEKKTVWGISKEKIKRFHIKVVRNKEEMRILYAHLYKVCKI